MAKRWQIIADDTVPRSLPRFAVIPTKEGSLHRDAAWESSLVPRDDG